MYNAVGSLAVEVSEGISEEKMSEYMDVFSVFDKDGDGMITTQELGTVIGSLGIDLSETELHDLLEQVDADGNGTIDFEEFLKIMAKRNEEQDKDLEIKETFNLFDKNGDGFINAEELNWVMCNLGQKLSHEEIEGMIKEADEDGNGVIDYSEFAKMMNKMK